MFALTKGTRVPPRIGLLIMFVVASCIAAGVCELGKHGRTWRSEAIHAGAAGALMGVSVIAFMQSFLLYRQQRPSFSLVTLIWLITAIGILCAGFTEAMNAAIAGSEHLVAPHAIAAARAVKFLGAGVIATIATLKMVGRTMKRKRGQT